MYEFLHFYENDFCKYSGHPINSALFKQISKVVHPPSKVATQLLCTKVLLWNIPHCCFCHFSLSENTQKATKKNIT